MPWYSIPDVESCCVCIPDLKTAVTIIAVLGIVTSPAVSWALMRHSYVIRVSCIITTHTHRPDVFDVNLNNVLSFGFAANAGLGPSCLSPQSSNSTAPLVLTVRYLGWVVLVFDLVFLTTSLNLLLNIFKGADKVPALYFMIAVSLSIFISFVYAMLYISACVTVGGSFPVFEFIFAVVDVGVLTVWTYFVLVVRSYLRSQRQRDIESGTSYYQRAMGFQRRTFGNIYTYIFNQLNWLFSFIYGYISIILIHIFFTFQYGSTF